MWQTLASALHQLTSLSPPVLALAVSLYGAAVMFCSLRWRAALWALGAKMSVATATLGTVCSVFINNVTPARVAGDVFRIGWLKRREGTPWGAATASVAVDRLIDLVPVAIIGLLSLPSLRAYVKQLGAPLILLAVVVGIAVVALLVVRRLPNLKAHLVQIREHTVGQVEKRGWKLLVAVSLSAMAWLMDLLRLSLIAHAFGVELDIPKAALLIVMIVVGSLMPTVGGLGAVEGGMAAALVWSGAPTDKALAITLVERVISYWLSTAAGGLMLLLLGGRKVLGTLDDTPTKQVPATSRAS